MGVGGEHAGDGADAGAGMRVGGQQRRRGITLLEKFEDGEGLGQRFAAGGGTGGAAAINQGGDGA
jgi:hypothetical protein